MADPILDGPLAQDSYEPSGDFKALTDAVNAGSIPKDKIDAAAKIMAAEIAKASSGEEIISIATRILGSLSGLIKL